MGIGSKSALGVVTLVSLSLFCIACQGNNAPGAPSEFLSAFRKDYGPTMNAFEAAEKNNRAADLQKKLEKSVQQPKQKPAQGCYLHSSNLLARYSCTLKRSRLTNRCSGRTRASERGEANDCPSDGGSNRSLT